MEYKMFLGNIVNINAVTMYLNTSEKKFTYFYYKLKRSIYLPFNR